MHNALETALIATVLSQVPDGNRFRRIDGTPTSRVIYFLPWHTPLKLARALEAAPSLHLVAVLPRFSDREGWAVSPTDVGRDDAVRILRRAGGDRVHLYDVENHAGEPVYVHAKAVIVDDVWAMIGSDNLNRRSWTHDSELSIAVASGFVEVSDDKVTILSDVCELPDEIDVPRAQAAKARAEEALKADPEDVEAKAALARAETRLTVAGGGSSSSSH